MPTVELSFSALPAHVRTARLVAAAVARRAGVEEAVLDEVRLAVGEACSRAVDLHRTECPDAPVRVALIDDPGAFHVEVTDQAPSTADEPHDVLAALGDVAGDVDGLNGESLPSGVGIAVISGLVDNVIVLPSGSGTSVRMSWPAGDRAPVPGL